ncbi:MAG: alpha-glucan family phosphorylase [Bacteroidetes bacterium]|nr:alpha-glucan family phosphorylase [Bacteroidota bacterium]
MNHELLIKEPVDTSLPGKIDGFDSLSELALDLRWSWDHSADEIWRIFDSELWDLTHNPWVVLQTVSRDRFQTVMNEPRIHKKIDELVKIRIEANKSDAWFKITHPDALLTAVAYFSMEFMLSEALPIYSGGLGNVAGDQLKTASDLGVPVAAVGLLYQQGYFRQQIDNNGNQLELYPYNDPGQLPISPLRNANGEWLRLEIAFPGFSVWLRAWKAQVGRVNLYLLDSNDTANLPVHRGITSELYGGGAELRLKQEMVLGIGGWRLLKELGIEPQVCHLNEGHAAFAILERAYCFMKDNDQPFGVALAATRAGNLFTTHTAVRAGFDQFPSELVKQYLGTYAENKLGISMQQLLGLGRQNPLDESEMFNMAYLAIRGSGAINGVSRLHGEVSRHIFEPLFPSWPTNEVPVGYVTNGVHMPTWDSKEADEVWTKACGKDRWQGMNKSLEANIRLVSDEKLWKMRTNANQSLIRFARENFTRQLAGSGASPDLIEQARHLFDPEVLTLGFARRFATYKRPNLLLHDPQRLFRLLTNQKFPVQLILTGKAHPSDHEGKSLINDWVQFIRQYAIHPPVIFLADYDMQIAENLVQGVDVWINTPRRPWEASGTSGMKVLVNGGINISELDGWWAEAYSPELGWSLGDGNEHGDDPDWDSRDAEQLYSILEQEVIPEFYNCSEKGIPKAWIGRMRESMAKLTPRFSADRTVREYTEQHYLPAAEAYLKRAKNKGEYAKAICEQLKNLENSWDSIRFGQIKAETVGTQINFEVPLFLEGIDPGIVQVELYADGLNGDGPSVQIMKPDSKPGGSAANFNYQAAITTSRPASDYTARVVPCLKDITVPLEISKILWQH